ncbi:MAG: hypothetical protein ACKO11_08060 [Cuspidothrix sp.]
MVQVLLKPVTFEQKSDRILRNLVKNAQKNIPENKMSWGIILNFRQVLGKGDLYKSRMPMGEEGIEPATN